MPVPAAVVQSELEFVVDAELAALVRLFDVYVALQIAFVSALLQTEFFVVQTFADLSDLATNGVV